MCVKEASLRGLYYHKDPRRDRLQTAVAWNQQKSTLSACITRLTLFTGDNGPGYSQAKNS